MTESQALWAMLALGAVGFAGCLAALFGPHVMWRLRQRRHARKILRDGGWFS